jgi:hypothetical protein
MFIAADWDFICVKKSGSLAGVVQSKNPLSSATGGHHPASQEALEIERHVGPERFQAAIPRDRSGKARDSTEILSRKTMNAIDGRIPLYEGLPAGINDPGDFRFRPGVVDG